MSVDFEAMHWDSKMHTAQLEIQDLHREIASLKDQINNLRNAEIKHLHDAVQTVLQMTFVDEKFDAWFKLNFEDSVLDMVGQAVTDKVDEQFINDLTDFDYIEERVLNALDTSSIADDVERELKDKLNDMIDEKLDEALDNLEVQVVR
jgi:cell division protein FtsB